MDNFNFRTLLTTNFKKGFEIYLRIFTYFWSSIILQNHQKTYIFDKIARKTLFAVLMNE